MSSSPVTTTPLAAGQSGDRVKVLFLINNLAGGGAERVLVNLVNAMDTSRYEVTLRTLFDEGHNRARLAPDVRYESVFARSFRGVNLLAKVPGRWVYNRVAGGDFDVIVVYLHGVLTKIVASAPSGQKTVAYLHANMKRSPFMKSFRTRRKIRECFQTYDAIVSVSKSVDASFREVSGLSDRLHVIYNTFDTTMIRDKAREPTGEGVIAGAPTINVCSVGKLVPVKGYDRLLSAARVLHAEGLEFKLLIVGDGEQRPVLQRYIDEHGLGAVVVLVGYDENPYKYMARCDLFVSSSYSEGFSSVVVESVVLGIPVLATDCSGMKEILGRTNEYGVVVKNSEAALLEGLRKLIRQPEIIADYRGKLASRAAQFEPEKSVADVEALLDSVMAGEH